MPALDRIYLLELEEGQDLAAALAAYRQDPGVEYAELNYLLYEHKTPSDTYFSIQWPLENTGQMYPESGSYNHPPGKVDADIDAPEAWDIFTGSADVVVAVIDTGVDYAHRDIDDNMWVNEVELNGTTGVDDDNNGYVDDIYGYDFYNRDGDPMDDRGHGTHCAGVIAAETDNLQDIAGVCWRARIMAVKFLGAGGSGTTSDAVKSFYYAVANGADVCSNSWGGGPYSETLEEALDYAASQGVILVASAGNDYSSYPKYPADYGPMIAVAATDSNDNKPAFSNYGSWVDLAATGDETGLSWTDAFTDLKLTMEKIEGLSAIPEIRVAQGTYYPAGPNGNRKVSFALKSRMVLRGGYAGVEGPNPDARDVQAYPTILSGDLNEDDGPEFLNYQDNSYHVVVGKNLDSNTVLDGFVIRAGNANGRSIHSNGGGMLNRDGSNPVIVDCRFLGNITTGSGGGMYIENSSPHLIRCRFGDNSLGGNSGGALYCKDGSPDLTECQFIRNSGGVGGAVAFYGSGIPVLKHCEFRENSASFGGGLYSRDNCNPIVIDCKFENNWAGYTGGALEIRGGNPSFTRCQIINNEAGEYDWGGSGISAFGGTITFESCTVTGNYSYENGGGMFVWNGIVYMENCTFSDNTAADMGGGIFLFSHLSGSATLRSCILWNENATEVEGKTISVQYSDVEGGYIGTGNKNEDPLFVDAAGGDYHLRWDSPCIDTGDPGYIPQPSDKDINKEPRVMRANRVDMGSDEVGPKQADFTRNGIIDVLDLSIFLESWLAVEGDASWYVLCDLFDNQQIDMMDYAQFAADWLWQAEWYED